MTFLTKDILGFYEFNKENNWYLTKFFTNTSNIGLYPPYAQNVIDKYPNGKSNISTVDEHNTYEINNFGFRGKIDKDADVIGAGCSITFGIGVPELVRWTNFLGNRLNKNVINLGSPGASVETICNNIIKYSLKTKMPKEIFCLFPDFFRSMVVIDKEFYKLKTIKDNDIESDYLQYTFCNPIVDVYKNSIFMKIENQKYIEDSTSPHQLILNSINFIYNLESFCFTNNIKLYWTTWDIPTAMIMDKLVSLKNFKLKNYTSFYSPNLKTKYRGYALDCILDHESEFKDSLFWHKGSDYSIINNKKNLKNAHPGIHFHYHFSDFFYNLYKKNAIQD